MQIVVLVSQFERFFQLSAPLKVIIQHLGYCEEVISVKEITFSMVCTCI